MEPLYDAGSGGLAAWVGAIGVGLGVAGFGLFRFMRREEDPHDPSVTGAGAVVFVLAGLAFSTWAAGNLWRAAALKIDPVGHRATMVEGCVRNYRTESLGRRRVEFTKFDVNGTPFHFNSSGWSSGYREAGRMIHPGDRLRIVMRNGDVREIFRIAPPCG